MQERSRGKLPFKVETCAAGPRTRLQHNIVAQELYRTVGGLGLWGQEAARPSQHHDPQRPTSLGFQLPHPTLGTMILSQGCGVESPTWKLEQPEGATREDLVDLR